MNTLRKGVALLLLGALTSTAIYAEETTKPAIKLTTATSTDASKGSITTDSWKWDDFSGFFQRIIIFSPEVEDPSSDQMISSQKLSAPISSAKDLASRVTDLETSYNLLAASYSDNYQAYVNSCGSDISKLCVTTTTNDDTTWSSFWSLCSNSDTDGSQCLLNHQTQLSSQCRLGLARYQNWVSLHYQAASFASGVPSFLTFFYVMFAMLILMTCCKICCRPCCQRLARRARARSSANKCDEEVVERIPTVNTLDRSADSSNVIVRATLVQEVENTK